MFQVRCFCIAASSVCSPGHAAELDEFDGSLDRRNDGACRSPRPRWYAVLISEAS